MKQDFEAIELEDLFRVVNNYISQHVNEVYNAQVHYYYLNGLWQANVEIL